MSAPEGSSPHHPDDPSNQPPNQRPAGATTASGAPSGPGGGTASRPAARPVQGQAIGLPPGVRIAELGPRLIAGVVDALPWIVLGLLQLVVSLVVDVPHWLSITIVVLDLAWLLFLGWQCTSFAATPGLRAMRLQLVAMANGRPLGWGRWLIRAVVLALLGATVVGWIVMAVLIARHPRRQSLPDLVVGSILIRQRAVAPRRQVAPSRPAATGTGAAQSPPPYRPTVPPAVDAGVLEHTEPVPLPPTGSAPAASDLATAHPNGSANNGSANNGATSDGATAAAPTEDPRDDRPGETKPGPPVPSPFFDTGRPATQYGPRPRGPQREPAARAMSYPTAADPRPYPGYGLPSAFQPEVTLPRSAPTAPEPEPVSTEEAPVRKRWQLTLDGDQVIEPTGLVLFGRNPQRAEGEDAVAVVKVRDEARTVSKTHVAVGVDDDQLFAVDRGSTNGSAVTTLDGDYKLLKAGERVSLTEGSTVAFGEHRLVVTLSTSPTKGD